MQDIEDIAGYGIAIVGMANRFPGASTPSQYWNNLEKGIESVHFYSDEELETNGVSAAQLKNPNYVKAGCPLDKMDHFDPDFFGFSPKEAGIIDPQHRQFYECCWEALESAGHPPSKFDGAIGVFAGSGTNAYFAQHLITNPELINSVGMFLLRHTGNDKDFLSTRVSYSFDLKGPSVNVQTACSTSSVAAHMACQSLLSEECDMAIAGGVTIDIPHGQGYLYKDGEILSPDGHCRAFDHRSKGTIFGSGAGAIVLRRLEDAIEDRDHIYGIIIGSAVNNDGSGKVGYLAPSVDGQSEAIAEALAIADVDAESIGYVECHGTGTPVGDPIEVAALTKAFKESSSSNGFCGLGSVKTNIGHLDTAAGVAGIIKASLSLKNKVIPPSLNYEAPNPTIDFDNSPFYVNAERQDWKAGEDPRRACVNSLGVGGTNAFVILEEAPEQQPSVPYSERFHTLSFSAKNKKSLDSYAAKLADHFEANPDINMADAAYTLFEGREHFEHRRVLAVESREDAIEQLRALSPKRVFTHQAAHSSDAVTFMFPGGGSQYLNMAAELYNQEPVFTEIMNKGFAFLQSKTQNDYQSFIFGDTDDDAAIANLEKPSVQLPLIFLTEYALAKLWIAKGIEPESLVGHSMGENTAACLAGVFSFEDGLGLVLLRGQLMDRVPEGGMLSVQAAAADIRPFLNERLTVASINSPSLTVISGVKEELNELAEALKKSDIDSRHVHINIAAHSWLLDDILDDFRVYLNSIPLNSPKIPIVSNYTGTWITNEQAASADYWVSHLRNTVKFGECINTLAQKERILLEVGPGNVLGAFARQSDKFSGHQIVSSLPHPQDDTPDHVFFTTAIGRLWAAGFDLNSDTYWAAGSRNRIPMPTYAFNHQPYWIEKVAPQEQVEAFSALEKIEDEKQWFSKPVWVQQGVLPNDLAPKTWLIFKDSSEQVDALIKCLRAEHHKVICVSEGDTYFKQSEDNFRLPPEAGYEAYQTLIKDLVASGNVPDRILHWWMVTEDESFRPGSSFFHRNQEHGFYSLFFLAKAFADEEIHSDIAMLVYTNGMQKVEAEALPYPEKATVLGPCKVIPREFPNITCTAIDIPVKDAKAKGKLFSSSGAENAFDQDSFELAKNELFSKPENGVVAYRGKVRWRQELQQVPVDENQLQSASITPGVYLITGGLGGIGHTLAQTLGKHSGVKLALIGRTPIPVESEWGQWLIEHGHQDAISQSIIKLKSLKESGISCDFYAADVTDETSMTAIVEDITNQQGAITGVIHAAGSVDDALIQMKQQSQIEGVFAPKVYGTQVLKEIFSRQPLDLFVVFSSTSTAIAPVGQIDYIAANDYLNAFAAQRNAEQPGRTLAISWGVWNQVGMAAKAATSMGYDSAPEETEHTVDYPLFSKHITEHKDGLKKHIFQIDLNTGSDWVLEEHRTATNQALLPGTAYIEIARAATQAAHENTTVTIEELVFMKALYTPDNTDINARAVLTQTSEGYQFSLQSQPLNSDENTWQIHAEANITLGNTKSAPETLDAIRARLSVTPDSSGASIKTPQEIHLNFGPRWKVLRQQSYGTGEALGFLSLDDSFSNDLEDFKVHPALLDIATGFAMDLIPGYGSGSTTHLWVPVSYEQFHISRPLTQEIFSWVRRSDNGNSEDFASFDVSLFDTSGTLLAEVTSLTIHQLSQTIDFSQAGNGQTVIEPAKQSSELRQLSPAEMAFQHNLSQGILPEEGARVFTAALTLSGSDQFFISSLDIASLKAEAEASAKELNDQEQETTKFSRPELDNEYVAPRDGIEKTLVGFWEELLGVDQVGVEDNFFDLGGHSLIAVRLFSKIQKAYDIDYPISVLFEAPTIAECSDMIRQSGVSDDDSEAEDSGDSKHKTRYTHLVPMQSSKTADNKPFFLVAGMFGNVLNLRHLAQLIGSDRPFYGLQARGLFGGHEPHETFEEMAKDYIAEMLSVQAEGPFTVGGFSGGGITAYEIARQLMDMGHKVNPIILLDTPLPYMEPISSVDRVSIHWQNLQKKGIGYFSDWAKSRYAWEMQKLKKRFGYIEEGQSDPAEFQSGVMEAAFYRALGRYEIKALDIPIRLFRPKLPVEYHLPNGRLARYDKQVIMEDNGWSRYVEDLEVIEVPGDHDSMVLEPNVRVLATKIRQAIQAL